ncbi:PAS domain-containing protein [Streptomyces sp. 4N509B]|uniref:PAS domain-containing protein n=1 Tax=Streptomyces sp. 4N509B TaxID=3457413 RepID=UPI003FD41F3C
MSSRPARGAARLAAILDALPDALLLVNGNGTVVNANAIAVETLQAPGAPLVGRGLLDIIPDFDPRRIPGSMRRPDDDPTIRTRPTRMVARRTDGVELHVEVTSAGLNAGHTPYAYASSIEAAFADDYSGDELLVLVVRDLSGTLDTEAELVRQQRQTEMILRAASEGVVGVDVAGRIVLVNPAAAQILGHRASQLGGQELHPLIQHSRADGSPLAFEETPLHDTLHSGRKHRVRGQVLWTRDGRAVPVDLTTAPVRDGDQLVGAVLAFTDRRPYDALAARHAQLLSVLGDSLRGPLEELRGELAALASDSAGQLWPEANQVLHHLAAGYSRMSTLLDNVLSFQRLDEGLEKLERRLVPLDEVVATAVEGATELIGPGRAQIAVHVPPIEAEVDAERMAQALAHLVADVAGVDATGRQQATPGGAPGGDSTIVVAAAQRGEVVRIEVRGPYPGGDPVHGPIVRGIVGQHGGVVQTHDVPGQGGAGTCTYVLEVPVAAGGSVGPAAAPAREGSGDTTVMPVPSQPARGTAAPTPEPQPQPVPATGTGTGQAAGPEQQAGPEEIGPVPGGDDTSGHHHALAPQPPPQPQSQPQPQPQPQPLGEQPQAPSPQQGEAPATVGGSGRRRRALAPAQAESAQIPDQAATDQPTGRRRRRAQAEQQAQAAQLAQAGPTPPAPDGGAGSAAIAPPAPPAPPAPEPTGAAALEPALAALPAPSPVPALEAEAGQGQPEGQQGQQGQEGTAEGEEPPPVAHPVVAASPILDGSAPRTPSPRQERPLPMPGSDRGAPDPRSLPGVSVQTLGARVPVARPAQPRPASAAAIPALPAPGPTPTRRRKLAAPPAEDDHRIAPPAPLPAGPTPAAGAPSAPAPAPTPTPAPAPPPLPQRGGGREFAISAPAADGVEGPEPLDGPNGAVEITEGHAQSNGRGLLAGPQGQGVPGQGQFAGQAAAEQSSGGRGLRLPEPADDELPPEPLDNPRRLLVWPEPDVSTQQALTDRGYRPVIVHSREEVDAQIAAYPAALFVDPLTGPITRTALQSLRAAAVAAEVPVLVTAGLGQASREAAYGADPAVLLKALAPRDSEQHPPRVLLVEEEEAIAGALAASLERRGMQAAHAPSDAAAMEMAQQLRPNLVVMDLNQVRRRRAGIIDWLRVNGMLSRTPFVVYTAAEMDPSQLPLLASGETVLFLAERSTHPEVQSRIVDLLTKIGAQ